MSIPKRNYRGVSAEHRRDVRRVQLVDAGLDLLGTEGWRKTTMTAVCARAGLTERYFYENFTNRDELLLAVLDRIAEQIRDVALDALARPGEPHEKAERATAALVDLLTDDPRIGRAAMLESAAADPLRTRRHELLLEFGELLATQAHALYGNDALPQPQAQLNGLMITGGLAELLMAWLRDELSITRDDIINTVTRQFTTTAQAPPATGSH